MASTRLAALLVTPIAIGGLVPIRADSSIYLYLAIGTKAVVEGT
ncbi:hypothetical protein ABIF65_005809 [Bradyrhizobium japonicum]|jgi:hypothetical protein|nr:MULTISPECIES: hypothetical protein [Bradyrhizobium]MCP1744146.1 hypothetical protein [Bradyrhizobium japonicum]MCP1782436.1 hypothetical protein [Bradyrhizobium japonicum]MCP1861864.1 hypothetical protein [Bradyrhizobium japonicum]MCP1892620.1 hypothetical protein [Bradyrhizobium japonicum]MCP1965274.1 hypothetical protein [Bradyrhizobium japonicum]